MIYGFFEDSTSLLLWSYKTVSLGYNTEIFFYYFLYFLSKFYDSVYLLSHIIFIIIILNIYSFYKLYYLFFKSKLVSLCVSLVTVFSPYMYYKSQNHPALINIWIYALFIYVLFFKLNFKVSMKKFSIFGLILGLTGLVSNYIFFFSVIFSIIFFMIQVLYGVTWRKDYYTILKSWIPKIIFFYIFLVIPFAYFNFNFIKTTFFEKKEDTSVNYYIERPIEDFFFFSSRPWYYVLPSVDNPFFGNVSRFVIESLQSRWGSFLTNNYFKSEHSASYLGYVNLIMAVLGIIYLRKNRFSENNNKLMFLGISALILILFSLNPYFDVFGVRIYLPSYLIVDYFSMFRVLSRIGILVLIVLLIFSGFGYLLLLDYLKKRTNNLLSYFVLTFFIMFSLVEFFVPLKFTDISKIPDVFEYLSKNTSKESKVLIMPDNKYNLSLFWSKDYNRDLIILNNLSVDGNFISSEDFNKKYFYSCAGLSQIKSKGTNYLIYFYNSDSNSIYKREFLNQNLEKIAEFNKVEQNDEIKTFFYRIIYTGNNFSNQAIIYKIPENLNCR